MGLTLNVTLTGSLDDIAIDCAELSRLLNSDSLIPGEFIENAPLAGQGLGTVAELHPVLAAAADTVLTVAAVPGAAAVVQPGAELDTAGLPWDLRINAKNRGKNTDGTWRAKRNINKTSPGLVEQVQNELRTALLSMTATGAPQPVAVVPVAPQPAAVAPGPGGDQLADTIALATQIVTHSTSPDTWGRINGIMIANDLPQGVQSLTQFPAKIPAVHMALQQLAKELGVG